MASRPAAYRILRKRRAELADAAVVDATDIFPVDSVLGHRVRQTRTGQRYPEVLVRWKGGGPEDETWERLDQFVATDLLQEYFTQHAVPEENLDSWPVHKEPALKVVGTKRSKKRKRA